MGKTYAVCAVCSLNAHGIVVIGKGTCRVCLAIRDDLAARDNATDAIARRLVNEAFAE